MLFQTKEVHGFFDDETPIDYSSEGNCSIIYHYTNEKGLDGILSNRKLWLMDSSGLNDRSEGKLILDKVKEELIKTEANELLHHFETHILKNLDSFFSCSFSAHGNLLSQWRGYGDNIAVGFDRCGLHDQPQIITKQDQTDNTKTIEERITTDLGPVKCQYIDPTDEGTLQKYIDATIKILPELCNNSNIETIQYCALKIGGYSTCAKHIGFCEEKEYRIVHYLWAVNGIKDPVTNRSRIEFGFKAANVKRIVIGPCKNQKEKICYIKGLLHELGSDYSHVEVYRSMIPFVGK
jgi:hypothetical protein